MCNRPLQKSNISQRGSSNDHNMHHFLNGDIENIKHLIKQGLDIHHNSQQIIYALCVNSHFNIIQYLISIGLNLKANTLNAFLLLCKDGNLQAVRFLLDNDIIVTDKLEEGLINACKSSNIKLVDYLIEKGADIHKWPQRLIYKLCRAHNYIMLDYLISKGINIRKESKYVPLWLCRDGNLLAVKHLVQKGVDFHEGDNEALAWAYFRGNTELITYLHNIGLKIGPKNASNALFYACTGKNYELATKLIKSESFIYINYEDVAGRLASEGDLESIQYLVQQGYDPLTTSWSVIYDAVASNNFHVVEYLLSKGANVDDHGGFALSFCCWQRNKTGVKYLLSKGADPNADEGEAIKEALKQNDYTILKLLLGYGGNLNYVELDALNSACYSGNMTCIKYLIKSGLNIQRYSKECLESAAQQDQLRVVKFLVENVTNLKSINHWVVYYAFSSDHFKVAKYLLSMGIGQKIKNSALGLCCEFNETLGAKRLLKNGANPNYKSFGRSGEALIQACRHANFDLIKALIKAGANITSTAVYFAFSSGNLDILKYLVKNGIDITSDPANLNVACKNGWIDAVKLLVANKMDLHNKTSAFSVALENRHFELVQYMLDQCSDLLDSYLLHCLNSCADKQLIRFIQEKYSPSERVTLFAKIENIFQVKNFIEAAASANNASFIRLIFDTNENAEKVYPNVFIKAWNSENSILIRRLITYATPRVKENILNFSCYYGAFDLVKFLIENGADIHAGNESGLIWACSGENENLDLVMYLIKNGANVHAVKDNLLSICKQLNHHNIYLYLNNNFHLDAA